MNPFAIYHTFKDHFVNGEQKLRQLLLEIVQPDAIYLLGATLNRRRTESIFAPSSPTVQHISSYFLLVLIPETMNKELYEWQDQIEQHLKIFATVTVIVLETKTFRQWLDTCHPFAVTVAEASVPIFKKDDFRITLQTIVNPDHQKLLQFFKEGITKAKSFLAGAELYIVRKEFKQAAFMLHQTTEQALITIIKTGMGYHSHTHNIDRLLHYASMVSYQLPEIFPRTTEREKQIFKLLQTAYSEARYSDSYTINYKELQSLFERVKQIVTILEAFRPEIFFGW